MNQTTRRQVLEKLPRPYETAGAEHKRKLIDQTVQLLGYHRKAAIRALGRQTVGGSPVIITGRKGVKGSYNLSIASFACRAVK